MQTVPKELRVLMRFGLFFAIFIIGYNSYSFTASAIIYNAQIITLSNKGIISAGTIIIKDDKILDIGSKSLKDKHSAPLNIDAKNNIVMPGLINAHAHIPMVAFRGLGEEGIKDRLFGLFFPLEKRFVTPEMVYIASSLACAEMIMGGTTTFADMYYYMDQEAKAAKEIGIRCVLGETIIGFPAPNAKTPDDALKIAVDFYNQFKDDPLIIPAIAPHTLYTVPEEILKKVAEVSKKYNIRVMLHIAEMPKDQNKHPEKDNIYYLQKIGLLNDRVTLAHAIHLNDAQLKLVAENGVGVSYNPMANAKGATGIANSYEMVKLGIEVGLGTDGPMSSNQLSMIPVLSYAANMQRILHMNRTIMTPETILYMATLGGAKALHIDDITGSIEVGKRADIIIVDTDTPNMFPHQDLYAAMVYQANPGDVKTVIINGKLVMLDRKLISYNLEETKKRFNTLFDKIEPVANELSEAAFKKQKENENKIN